LGGKPFCLMSDGNNNAVLDGCENSGHANCMQSTCNIARLNFTARISRSISDRFCCLLIRFTEFYLLILAGQQAAG
jgi:hypothetical protein